jgi:hypothetical protein
MGLFSDWFDRVPKPAAPARRARRLTDAELFTPTAVVPRGRRAPARQPLDLARGVEVSELEVSDDELSTLFGASTQFPDALDQLDQHELPDPWKSTTRNDP